MFSPVSFRLSQVEAAKSSLVTAQEELQHLAEMAADVARSEQIADLTEERDGEMGEILSKKSVLQHR